MPGPWEMAIILVIVILIFGGSKIAKLGNDLGTSIKGFREAVKDIEDEEKNVTQGISSDSRSHVAAAAGPEPGNRKED